MSALPYAVLHSGIDWSFIDYSPTSDEDFLRTCLSSKLWRMNNIYKVKNKQGQIVTFRMNPLQRKVAECPHNRKIILKSRQVGISTYHLLYNLDEAIFEPHQTNGVMAQGLLEAGELLEKAKLAWAQLDPAIMSFLSDVYGTEFKCLTNNTQELEFSNGSKLQVRTSFRSGTLQNLHVSELGKIAAENPAKARELKTGTFQAIGGKRKVTVESTAEGKSGYFYELWSAAETHTGPWSELDFYPIFISWVEDPDCELHTPRTILKEDAEYFQKIEEELLITLRPEQKYFYLAKKKELGLDITQEYPSTPTEAFMAARDGAYYSKQLRDMRLDGRIRPKLYDPNLPVHVAMDLGMNDTFSMFFYQIYRKELRIIDEYANNGEAIRHYVNYMEAKPYSYADINGPHDLAVKELGTGKSRREVFQELGVDILTVRNIPVTDGIEACRMILPSTWVDENCTMFLSMLENYTKEWDDKRSVWKDKPLHNEYSHPADAFRYLTLSDAVSLVFQIAISGDSEANDGDGEQSGAAGAAVGMATSGMDI